MAKKYIVQGKAEMESECDNDSLPNRLINPNKYEPLSHTRQEHRVAEPRESNEMVDKEPRRLTPVYTYGSTN